MKGTSYPNTSIKSVLSALLAALPSTPQHKVTKAELPAPRIPKDKDATHITQSYLWPSIERFLQQGDIIIGETGTSVFGLCDIKFPARTQFEAQIYYGSIGWAAAAVLGAEVARKEMGPDRRTLLFTGDGSFAMTIQEIGTMIKQGLKLVVFVINNEGYTIERLIWGARQSGSFSLHSSNTRLIFTQRTMISYPLPTNISFHSSSTLRHQHPSTARPQKLN